MYSYQAESIFIYITQDTYDEMVKEGFLWPEIETGGMLFGKVIEEEARLTIKIVRTHIPPDDNCVRKAAYFEIDPEYAKNVLSQEKQQYLGNWHKHPGYGGPSHGDHRQIEDFFRKNSHLDVILTFIINFNSEVEFEPIIEVYFRGDESFTENHSFRTRRVPQSNLTFTIEGTEMSTPLKEEKGVPSDILTQVKHELVNIFDHLTSTDEIEELTGQTPDEKVLSFPYQFTIKLLDQLELVNLLILISFPPEFPDGKIFCDFSSEDMSKNITFKTHPAETLNDKELINPFLLLLKTDIEDDIPSLLEQPLWQILQDKK
ncbi:hypothetical protein CEE45_11805 [Candidatus Heimdallarchaeota archaeon B3_Heim]|nr:MAG: hypothetical protein CEE45_11805 [Candidatus Heimdallarchaeota archaeon B3_Heim]